MLPFYDLIVPALETTMAKNRKSSVKNSGTGVDAFSNRGKRGANGAGNPSDRQVRPLTLYEWLIVDHRGLDWMASFIVVGLALGFMLGFAGGSDSPWRQQLAESVRSSGQYQFVTLSGPRWKNWMRRYLDWSTHDKVQDAPSHSRVFAILREAVVREKGGYVHPDLGVLFPAPCGSVRGLGMVRDRYHSCQRICHPATNEEKRKLEGRRARGEYTDDDAPNVVYPQEEVLLRVPLKFQMTRQAAQDLLSTLIPVDVQQKAGMQDLDDAALLVLFLAHERGVGFYSRWSPYIASLPPEPTCGYSRKLRPFMLNALEAYKIELGVETDGWTEELYRAMTYGEQIAEALHTDYGSFLKSPVGVASMENIQWALCQVASRATAGSEKHGSLRLVPLFDLINHDAEAGGFVELSGTERLARGDFVDSTEDDNGTIVVRSLRHGRRKSLRKGQELLVNYNVPSYTPLDWFVALGFVPPERWGPWEKFDAVLPQLRRDGPFQQGTPLAEEVAYDTETQRLQHLETMEL